MDDLETFLSARPQAGVVDHLAQLSHARAHRLHGSSLWLTDLVIGVITLALG